MPWLAAAALLLPGLRAQQPEAAPRLAGTEFGLAAGSSEIVPDEGDYVECRFGGGFRFTWPRLGIEIHGRQGLLLLDRDEFDRALRGQRDPPGLPRRGMPDPDPGRSTGPDAMRARLEAFLRAAGRPGQIPDTPAAQLGLALPRFLYFEGGVSVLRQGTLVARAERLWISPLDDRMVLEQVELRYASESRAGTGVGDTFTVRGPRLVKQGPRWTGRDLILTACTAGEPHVALRAGEAEIVERGDQFEVWSRGNRLQFSGTSVLPLPDAHFFTGEQSEFPIKGASAGYSSSEGMRLGVDVGLQWNRTGGALHEFLTGRPAGEFRGDWLVGVGWIEQRGFPLDGRLDYRVPGLYEGRTDLFYLDDDGRNIREITSNIDGSAIDERGRTMVRSRNRVHLDANTHLDLTLHRAGDAAVYPEFFGGEYRSAELPETSAYLHHGVDNRLLTVSGRWNLDEFSYRDNRSLAPSFTEELPVATFHWFSQPIGTTPWDTPVVIDLATELGQRRSDFDDRFAMRISDRTFRADQLVEVSTPFGAGPVTVRPYAAARGTWYDADAMGESAGRMAYEVGVRAGTRLSRSWGWLDQGGKAGGIRHVVAPVIGISNRFHVDGEPGDYRQFDPIDGLDEETRLRFELRNLLQHTDSGAAGTTTRDFLFLDLAQNVFPDADRDNGGDELGLFEYELLLRPRAPGIDLSTLAFAVEGEHDWRDGMRTFNTELRFGRVLGFDWTAEYRTDQRTDGTVGMGALTSLFGRWELMGGAQYDLELDDWLTYSVGLVRNDHDWQITVGAAYSPYIDEVTFRIDFQPRGIGRLRPRQPEWFGSERLHGRGSATDF